MCRECKRVVLRKHSGNTIRIFIALRMLIEFVLNHTRLTHLAQTLIAYTVCNHFLHTPD